MGFIASKAGDTGQTAARPTPPRTQGVYCEVQWQIKRNRGVARANFVQWLLNAGAKAPVFWLLSRFSTRWAYRSMFESSRLRFCLQTCGKPFWRSEFGRNYAPDAAPRS